MENLKNKKPSESIVNMEQLVMPNDANNFGTLFGGRLLQWMDLAGAMAATKHARCNVVTVAVDSVEFNEPVLLADMVKLIAKVTWTGKTSIEVKINVFREKTETGETIKTNIAFMTFVAMDNFGKPTAVPHIVPETDEEIADNLAAEERRANRLKKRK